MLKKDRGKKWRCGAKPRTCSSAGHKDERSLVFKGLENKEKVSEKSAGSAGRFPAGSHWCFCSILEDFQVDGQQAAVSVFLISLASSQLRRAGPGSGTTSGTLNVDTSLQVILNVFLLLFPLVSVVPPNISELKNLEVLNMFNNQIEELPTQISSLQKLKHLNLG